MEFGIIGSGKSKSHISIGMKSVCGSDSFFFSEGAQYQYENDTLFEKLRGKYMNTGATIDQIIDCKKCLSRWPDLIYT